MHDMASATPIIDTLPYKLTLPGSEIKCKADWPTPASGHAIVYERMMLAHFLQLAFSYLGDGISISAIIGVKGPHRSPLLPIGEASNTNAPLAARGVLFSRKRSWPRAVWR